MLLLLRRHNQWAASLSRVEKESDDERGDVRPSFSEVKTLAWVSKSVAYRRTQGLLLGLLCVWDHDRVCLERLKNDLVHTYTVRL